MLRNVIGRALTRTAIGRRVLLTCVACAAVAATSLAAATAVANAGSAPNICTKIGLTKAAARKVFGPTVKVTLSPNSGEDVAACLVARPGVKFPGYGVGALVELFTTNQLVEYEGKAVVKKPLGGLGKGAVVLTNPASPEYPGVFFTAGGYFVAITANPPEGNKAETAAQVTMLAREIHSTLG